MSIFCTSLLLFSFSFYPPCSFLFCSVFLKIIFVFFSYSLSLFLIFVLGFSILLAFMFLPFRLNFHFGFANLTSQFFFLFGFTSTLLFTYSFLLSFYISHSSPPIFPLTVSTSLFLSSYSFFNFAIVTLFFLFISSLF